MATHNKGAEFARRRRIYWLRKARDYLIITMGILVILALVDFGEIMINYAGWQFRDMKSILLALWIKATIGFFAFIAFDIVRYQRRRMIAESC